MNRSQKPSPFWLACLQFATYCVAAFGLVLVVAPSLARNGFARLVYLDSRRIDNFGPDAVRYITLVHGVIGALMIGWATALAIVNHRLVSRGSLLGWRIVAASIVLWFLPDTLASLLWGFWQNAI